MQRIRIGRVTLFLFLTFALSWGFDLLMVAARGRRAYLDSDMTPWGMFVPAFVALVLQLFIFDDSPIYFRKYKEKPRWILLAACRRTQRRRLPRRRFSALLPETAGRGSPASFTAYSDEIVHEFRACRPLIPNQGDHGFRCPGKTGRHAVGTTGRHGSEKADGIHRNRWSA